MQTAYRPALMISFGKDGISGHIDHISVDKEVAKKLKALHFHKSQLDFEGPFAGLSPEVVKQFLSSSKT